MLRTGKIAGILFFFALMSAAPAFAQNQAMPQQQQEKIEVSDAELQKFAQAYQQMRLVNQEAQQKMLKVVQDEGFEVQRFNEIHQASMDPNKEVEMTDEEKAKHEETVKKIEAMQPEFQTKMEEVITSSGLSLERYQQLAMALQTDPQLQQRLRDVMQG